MPSDERSSLVLALARILFVNGQATEQTVAAAEGLARRLGLRVTLMPRWGELQLQSSDKDVNLISQLPADPTGVDMDRVASAMRLVQDVETGKVAPAAAMRLLGAISRAPPAPTWLFTLAAAAGAVALAVIFGVKQPTAAVLIFLAGGAGAQEYQRGGGGLFDAEDHGESHRAGRGGEGEKPGRRRWRP